MNHHLQCLTFSILSLGLAAGPGSAWAAKQEASDHESTRQNSKHEASENVSQESQPRHKSYQHHGDGQFSQTMMQGRIEAFRHVLIPSPYGSPERQAHIRLQTQNHGTRIVDIGPKRNLDHLQLRQGDYLQVWGYPSSRASRSIFVAERLNVDGLETVLRPKRHLSDEVTLVGTIEGMRRVSLQSPVRDRQEHALVCLQLENGSSTVVDLGLADNIKDLNPSQGDVIRLEGHRGRIDGRRAFLADEVTIDGQTKSIARGAPEGRELNSTSKVRAEADGGSRQQSSSHLANTPVQGAAAQSNLKALSPEDKSSRYPASRTSSADGIDGASEGYDFTANYGRHDSFDDSMFGRGENRNRNWYTDDYWNEHYEKKSSDRTEWNYSDSAWEYDEEYWQETLTDE